MNKLSTRDKFLKHFFGITGTLDEYKRNEANRIGTNAFMGLYAYLLISTFLAFVFINIYPELTLWVLLAVNLLMVIYGVGLYIMGAARKTLLTENEAETKDIPQIKQQNRRQGIRQIVFFAVGFHILQAFASGHDFLSHLQDPVHIGIAAVSGVFFGLTMTAIANSRIKEVGQD